MPEYLTPGLYVEEIDSGSKPIEGVGTNTCAFVGYAKSGEFNQPTFISSWSQFCDLFGQEENALVESLALALNTTTIEVAAMKKASRKGWAEFAEKTVDVAAKAGKPLKDKDGKAVKNFREFCREYQIPLKGSPYIDGTYLAHSVYGYYLNGGARAYIVRVPRKEDMKVYTNGLSGKNGAAAPKAIEPARAQIGPMTFIAKETGVKSGEIEVAMEPVEGDEFRIKISHGAKSEVFPAPDGKMKATGVKTAVEKSTLVMVEVAATPKIEIKPMTVKLEVPAIASATPLASTGTSALAAKSPVEGAEAEDFQGDEARRTGMGGLSVYEDVNMICVPDLMAGAWQRPKFETGEVDESGNPKFEEGEEVLVLGEEAQRQKVLDFQCNLVQYCENLSSMGLQRMAILDPLPGLNAQEMRDITNDTPYGSEKGQAAIYYPWILVSDPLRKGKQVCVPPSGHVAGVWARAAGERGVHKAPANEVLRGAVALETYLTKQDQAILNPDGINAIRAFPGEGIKIYGARTLATRGNPSWKYVNVRRLFNYLEASIQKSMGWAVFEPNDQDLWGRLRRNIAAFLFTEWKEGKLFGEVPSEAFYVKCDNETNPQEMIDLGRVYVEVGINPVKPAEFVIIRMGQWSGGLNNAEG